MSEEIRTLQDWSLEHLNMIPITIDQLSMIEKEYKSWSRRVSSITVHQSDHSNKLYTLHNTNTIGIR